MRLSVEMDPTARTMRVITTCNGGDGTDWNVIQNWSGTYGGDVNKYAGAARQIRMWENYILRPTAAPTLHRPLSRNGTGEQNSP